MAGVTAKLTVLHFNGYPSMSEFSESYHLRSERQDDAVELLRRAKLKGYVYPPTSGWVTFLAEQGVSSRTSGLSKLPASRSCTMCQPKTTAGALHSMKAPKSSAAIGASGMTTSKLTTPSIHERHSKNSCLLYSCRYWPNSRSNCTRRISMNFSQPTLPRYSRGPLDSRITTGFRTTSSPMTSTPHRKTIRG